MKDVTKEGIDIIIEFINETDTQGLEYSTNPDVEFIIVDAYYNFSIFNKWLQEKGYDKAIEEETNNTNYDMAYFDYLTNDKWGYNDQWAFCDMCGEPIQIVPTSGRSDPHWINNGEIYCKKCVQEYYADDYINDKLINYETGVQPYRMPTNTVLNDDELEKRDFEKCKDLCLSMEGKSDNIIEILNQLVSKNKNTDYLLNFYHYDGNPFYVEYELWKKENAI